VLLNFGDAVNVSRFEPPLMPPDEVRREFGIDLHNTSMLRLSRRGDLPPVVRISERKGAFVQNEIRAHFANCVDRRASQKAA
jgi:hypothetical protein